METLSAGNGLVKEGTAVGGQRTADKHIPDDDRLPSTVRGRPSEIS
jgi:hypothetical protein